MPMRPGVLVSSGDGLLLALARPQHRTYPRAPAKPESVLERRVGGVAACGSGDRRFPRTAAPAQTAAR